MKHLRGSSIIEVLIAATLISVAILAALSLSSRNQKQTDFSRSLNAATFYNDQASEWIGNMRTTLGWAEFVESIIADQSGGKTTYCLSTLPETTAQFITLTGSSQCVNASIMEGGFQREMVITFDNPPTTATILVHTYWDNRERHTQREVTLTKW